MKKRTRPEQKLSGASFHSWAMHYLFLLKDAVAEGIALHFGVKNTFFVHAAVADIYIGSAKLTYPFDI